MARKAKVQKMGYALSVNSTAAKGAANWKRVGFLFNTRSEALAHKSRYYATVSKFTVAAVRLNVEPLQPPRAGDDRPAPLK